MEQEIATWGTLSASITTALATFFLWRVTKILAIETKRMADASAQPQVVASITLNKWAMNHADLVVENTGNATAFDIEITFDPPLENGEVRPDDHVVPFQRVSILKPAQSLSSYLSESAPLIDQAYNVSISWKLTPLAVERQTLSYTFRMGDYKGMSQLGASDPSIQIAEQVKKIREDWKGVATGQKKLRTDIFTEAERQRERQILDERYGRNVSEPIPEVQKTVWTTVKRLLRFTAAP